MIKKITSKPLWVNILVGLFLITALGAIFILSLDMITRHGDSKTVPAVTGKHVDAVSDLLAKEDFIMVIQDSVYDSKLKPGVVIKQFPEPDAVVKKNRNVYVTINRLVLPEVEMPNLVGYSYRNAEMVLVNMDLRVGDTSYRFDYAKNSILDQSISPGSKIRVGTKVNLVLGSGPGDLMAVPKFVGLTYAEAKVLSEAQGISLLPLPSAGVRDTLGAFVVQQDPMPRTEEGLPVKIRQGQMITIWLSVEPPVIDSVNRTPVKPKKDEENDY